ncbi:MAG: phenylacetate--CoA ligase family protein [Deltaproteobacteria bacterium]|nr:phenylacetate--CoA ligase family protein [Deltaproteobacteria bacterium]
MAGKIRFFPEKLNDMSPEERKEHKDKLLSAQVQYVYDNSPEYYQLRFKECGAEPGDIKTLEDLRKLPIMMDKDSERQSEEDSLEKYGHPFGLHLCCRPEEVVSTGGTSGTTGHPTYPYTQSLEDTRKTDDIAAFFYRELCGVGPGDRCFFLFPLGVYATSVLLPGLQKTGVLPLPIDIRLGPKMAMEMAKWTKPTFWCTGAAIVEFYIDLYKKQGIDPRDLGYKCLVLTGEMGCGIPEIKKKIEDAFGCRWYDFWAPSLLNWAMSCDSDEYYGLHKFGEDWDIGYEDLVDPETKEQIEIKDGAIGEIVGTHLTKKAAPYLKYASGDIVEVFTSECPGCGFKGMRARVTGRSDDMLTVKGVNVFGGAIRSRLQKFVPRVTGHMRIIKEDPSHRVTQLKLRVEYASGMENQLDGLAKEIRDYMRAELRVSPEIEWTPPDSLDRPARKPPIFEKRY